MSIATEEYRLPPHAGEEEKALLGAILSDSKVFDLLTIRPEHFFKKAYGTVFEVMKEIHESRGSLDNFSLIDALAERDKLDFVGGTDFIADLEGYSSAHAEFYAKQVVEKAHLRRVLSALESAAETIRESGGARATDVFDSISGPLFDAFTSVQGAGDRLFSAQEAITGFFKRIEEIGSGVALRSGLDTGFSDLDKLLCGLNSGDLIIIAGRPSMGKTTFLLNILRSIVGPQRERALFFSLESGVDAMVGNIIAAHAKLSNRLLRTGMISQEERSRMTDGGVWFRERPLFIEDSPINTVHEIRAKARLLHAKQPLALIAIDYLQLIRSRDRQRYERRDLEVADITARLKALAKELSIPVIALAQLNRAVESRTDHRPRLSDLRESGSIEQDADVVIFLHRPGYYSSDPKRKASQEAEAIVAKNRNGPIGTANMMFLYEKSRFEQRSYRENSA